jgi:hypothetical protein
MVLTVLPSKEDWHRPAESVCDKCHTATALRLLKTGFSYRDILRELTS